ncbi:RDD family protein [Kitasatospora sp. MAP5-34]|uniref:RDD family protein n=1 Tax=Kitasatospora sp. MAP5-34 TaxID=3035102 RepID=UPI00247664A9|nr:RDD family protein [Kitasatospora sp. MAP5-34]MDH6578123.1 putative RDD family membrane protein YckC [Kitasatospora sp. MAP5-34]
MSYPPDPNNPYGQQPPQQPQQPGYGYPQQTPPPAPGYGYPQQPPVGYGAPQGGGYGAPPQPGPYGNAAQVQQFYAGWGSRVAAFLIDGLIVGVPVSILYGIALGIGGSTPTCVTDPNTFQSTCTGGGISGAGLAVMGVAWLLGLIGGLFLLYQEGTTGQTPGKKLVNIRVLRESDGQPLGFGMAFVRRLCHILDEFVCCLGFLWPLWDAKKQTFADKIVSSVVVKSQ